jgi:surfeit locus 1 family protein
MRLERRDWTWLLFALAATAVCVRLGVWQLDRLGQRRERNEVASAARKRPPLVVTGALTADTARDRRLFARGTFDYAHERLWHGRSYEGIPGVDLITPLRLDDGSAVLVDRGWAPSPDGYHVDAQAYREPDTAVIQGLGMTAPRGRGDVELAKLQDSLPYRLLPFVLQQSPSDGPTVRPSPRRWPLPELSDGPHLSYAIQWFSFAIIIVAGSAALLRKGDGGGRGGRAAAGEVGAATIKPLS